MATNTNKRIQISELDFDNIKAALINFLQGQSEFSDFDFAGSGLNVLLDLLAFNTHYNALYANLAVNESFLDSASKRNSVVSRAKDLGYVGSSSHGAFATVDITVTNPTGNPDTLTLPQYSQFTATINGQSFNFWNIEAKIIQPVGGVYKFSGVKIFEGTPITNRITVVENQRYIIPNVDSDMDTLSVRVQENSASSLYQTYTHSDGLVQIDGTSLVYFLKEIDGQLFEVYFGDGALGAALNVGNVVNLTYLVTHKAAANGCKRFSFTGNIGGGTVTVTTVATADGGTELEDPDTIKFRAPLSWASQKRAVTTDDYKVILPALYSNVASVNVWGGEDAVPPVYGKVYLAVKPRFGDSLALSTKADIARLLQTENLVTITPVILDPDFVLLNPTVNFYYNPKATSLTGVQLGALVTQVIQQYNDTELDKFEAVFRLSRLQKLIDDADISILNNATDVVMQKDVVITTGVATSFQVDFGNPIWNPGSPEENALASTPFTVNGIDTAVQIDEDGAGNVRIYSIVNNNVRHYFQNIGTVNYTTGTVIFNNVFITSAGNSTISIFAKSSSNTLISNRNFIIKINEPSIVVNPIIDTIASGLAPSGTDFIYSNDR